MQSRGPSVENLVKKVKWADDEPEGELTSSDNESLYSATVRCEAEQQHAEQEQEHREHDEGQAEKEVVEQEQEYQEAEEEFVEAEQEVEEQEGDE